jgi:hypothetical protein
MLAINTLALERARQNHAHMERRSEQNHPTPRYGEDVKWLLKIALKLGNKNQNFFDRFQHTKFRLFKEMLNCKNLSQQQQLLLLIHIYYIVLHSISIMFHKIILMVHHQIKCFVYHLFNR